MEGHELSYILVAAEITEKIAEIIIDLGRRRGKLKILVQQTGVLRHQDSIVNEEAES